MTKLLPVSEDTHSEVMQFKAKQKLRTVDAAIQELLHPSGGSQN